ncbi:MAG: hypothetical protein J6S14_11510 [Clostridia bacterium]|nr:hypothetical protein [Clostridia bacterium]
MSDMTSRTDTYEDAVGNDKITLSGGKGEAVVLRTVVQDLTPEQVAQVKKNLHINDLKDVYIAASGHLMVVDSNGNVLDAGDARGLPGQAPYIGRNGNWYIVDRDTGVRAEGLNPHVGDNGNWFIGDTDTGVRASGDTPYINAAGYWCIGDTNTGVSVYTYETGDVKETMRTDLGEVWALCNGDPFTAESYPTLAAAVPYRLDFKSIPVSGTTYTYVKPAASERYWLLRDKVSRPTAVAIYDAYTGDVTRITSPAGSNSYVFGVYHDGARWVMGVEASSSPYTVYVYTSDDLSEWAQVYSSTSITGASTWHANDLIYDGVTYDILASKSSSYKVFILKADFSGISSNSFTDETNTDNSYELAACPQNKWMYRLRDGSSGTIKIWSGGAMNSNIAPGGTTSSNDENLNCLEFFNDTYAFQTGHDSSVKVTTIYIFNLVSAEVSRLSVSNIGGIGGGTSTTLEGMMFDKNTDEWVLYIYNATLGAYAARVSADSDPTVADNYRVEAIEKVPDILPVGQSSIGRGHAHVDGENVLLYCPTVRYLPEHSGDTYKYIKVR